MYLRFVKKGSQCYSSGNRTNLIGTSQMQAQNARMTEKNNQKEVV